MRLMVLWPFGQVIEDGQEGTADVIITYHIYMTSG